MLYRLMLALSLVLVASSPLFASLSEEQSPLGSNEEFTATQPVVPLRPWGDAPLVSFVDGQARSNPTLVSLIPQLSKANSLIYAISKYSLAAHFYGEHLAQLDSFDFGGGDKGAMNAWVARCRRLTQEMASQEQKGGLLLAQLRGEGWVPAFGQDGNQANWILKLRKSLILGKSGSVDGGFIDNIAGVLLFHRATGTLLSVYHGSRADDFVPVSHDWFANLDTATIEVDFCGQTIKVHRGFWNTADHSKPVLHSRILSAFRIYGNLINRVLFAGHSHGSAVSAFACMVAAADLGPQVRGAGFNNVKENLFCHFGLSEPAALHIESREYVRSSVGADNFMHAGVLHDFVVQMFRAEVWEDFGAIVDSHVAVNQTTRLAASGLLRMLSDFAPSARWQDILVMMSDPKTRLRYSHIGHLALENYRDLIGRVGRKLLGRMSVDMVAIVGAVHYGGEGANFDQDLPMALSSIVSGNLPYLDTMLQVARESEMTVARFVKDIKAIKRYVADGGALGDGMVAVIENADAPGGGEALVALGAGTAAYVVARNTQEAYNNGEIGGWGYALRMLGATALGGVAAVKAKQALEAKARLIREEGGRK